TEVLPPAPVRTADSSPSPERLNQAPVPFVGRIPERRRLDEFVTATANGVAGHVLLVKGQPGIGKTRLLGYLQERMTMIGGQSLRGRTFEAEAMRPYGVWIDALR